MTSLYKSDFLKIYEKRLNNHYYNFFLKCDKFKQKWDEVNEIFQANFNECDCENAGIKDKNFLKKNCTKKLREMSNLMKHREDLKNQIIKQKLIEVNPKPIDFQLLGLPVKKQNAILAQRVKDLEYSKHMAQKIIDELLREGKFTEQKEIEVTIEMKNNDNSMETLKILQLSTETEVNAEVKRLKENFVETYAKKWRYKKKYEDNDEKIRTELMFQEKKIREELLKNKMEMSEVKTKIEDQKKKLKEEDFFETLYGDKYEIFVTEMANKLKDIARVENESFYLQKYILKIEKETKLTKEENANVLQNLKENSFANQRINEIYRVAFSRKFEDLEEVTIKEFNAREKTIEDLKNNICNLADQICQSNVIVEQLKDDVNFFMSRDLKFVMGADYMGGTMLCVNK